MNGWQVALCIAVVLTLAAGATIALLFRWASLTLGQPEPEPEDLDADDEESPMQHIEVVFGTDEGQDWYAREAVEHDGRQLLLSDGYGPSGEPFGHVRIDLGRTGTWTIVDGER